MATAAATSLRVPADRLAAFNELYEKRAQRDGRTPSAADLSDWKDVLSKGPSEVEIAAFLQGEVVAAKIAAAAPSERARARLVDTLVFTCAYGKASNNQKALPFDEALTRVLRDVAAQRAGAAREGTAGPAVQYQRGKLGKRHLEIRAAAFPYRPACGSSHGAATVDAIDSASQELLGYICVDMDSGYIDDLSVHPLCQGRGVARGLVTAAAAALAADDDDATISLHVRALNRPALRLYGSLGLVAGDNEFPPWYDYHGGFHLEAPAAAVAAHQHDGGRTPTAAAAAAAAPRLPEFVSLFHTVSEARNGSRAQSGASNCGATAVSTQLAALGVRESPQGEVVVRARDYHTRSLYTYLNSRSKAGCTADDLVSGAGSLSAGACVAAFFPTGPSPPSGLCAWLAEMLALGAAPIATINTQLDGADYWHHQAVLGVFPQKRRIMLANPCEEVDEAELARLLGSSSEMLIYRSDVLQRCPPSEADVKAMRAEGRWAALQVAEQIEEVMAGGVARGDGDRVVIPASYTPGITLIAKVGSEAATQLRAIGHGPWRT